MHCYFGFIHRRFDGNTNEKCRVLREGAGAAVDPVVALHYE
jgi:hypothetical protein